MVHRTASARTPARVFRASLGLALALTSLSMACGSTGAQVDERSFERGLIEREHLTQEEAGCVGRYVYAAYSSEEIRRIQDEGITSLPSPRWSEYGHAMVGCMFHDELSGGKTPAPTPTPTSAPRPAGGP